MIKFLILGFVGGLFGYLLYFVILSSKGFDSMNEAIAYLSLTSIFSGVCGSIFAMLLYKQKQLKKKK